MAGAPWGPAGTIGPRSMDLSPWMNQLQMQQQAAIEQRRRQQDDEQFTRELEFKNTARKTAERMEGLALKRQETESERNARLAGMELELRAKDQEARSEVEKGNLKAREKEIEQREKDTTASNERRLKLEAKQSEDEQQSKDLVDFAARFRAMIPPANSDLVVDPRLRSRSPEDIRDHFLQLIATEPFTAEQRMVAQREVDAWYNDALKREDTEFKRKSAAEKLSLDAETKRATIAVREEAEKRLAADQVAKAIARDVAPFRKQQERIATKYGISEMLQRKALLEAEIVKLQGAAAQGDEKAGKQLATYQNALAATASVLARADAEYASLDAKIAAIEAKYAGSTDPAINDDATQSAPPAQDASEHAGNKRAALELAAKEGRRPPEWAIESDHDRRYYQRAVEMYGG